MNTNFQMELIDEIERSHSRMLIGFKENIEVKNL